MDLQRNIQQIQQVVRHSDAKLVAVTKTYPVEVLQEAYDLGLRAFGENKVQELIQKFEVLPRDIEWHLIGHLQSNKVKHIAPFVHLIHSVDSMSLLKEINKQAEKNFRVIDCLLQIHIAKEETKFGLSEEEAVEIIRSHELPSLKNIKIIGLMGMATNTSDESVIRAEFRSLKTLFELFKRSYASDVVSFHELSMGMSSDYKVALEEGSTMVRVGSSLFGKRDYQQS
ncbi:MAG TPA: YggS family pyridoxal phosphate-dependent enzyme [Cytophagaceae bacterium]|jgi:hypothetical protein